MARIVVSLSDKDTALKISELLNNHEVILLEAEELNRLTPPKATEAIMEQNPRIVILNYLGEDSARVKLLQHLTEEPQGPRVIFYATGDIPVNQVAAMFNEGAQSLLLAPLNELAFTNNINRALKGPGRFRFEAVASCQTEIQALEAQSAHLTTLIKRYELLVPYLLSTPLSVQKRKVLLVSDSAYQRDLLRKMLEDHNFMVFTAANSQEAISQAEKEHPVIVVSDFEIGEKNGIDLCRILKFEQRLTPCHFVICTANADKIGSCMTPGNGVDDCLQKPSNPTELNELLTRLSIGLLL